MSPRTGRPKSDDPRTEIVRARVTEGESALIVAAAERAGQTVSDWSRARLVAAARRSR